MAYVNDSIATLLDQRVLAIVRLPEYSRAVEVASALARGGIGVLELTLTGEGALAAIARVRETTGASVRVGAGTVLSARAAEAAVAAGAEFLVTPAIVPEVLAFGAEHDLPVLCGALSPTEVLGATTMGAAVVKLFPANLGGPSYLKALRGPFPDIRFMPTGGLSEENLQEYLRAGACAVALGGELVRASDIVAGNWDVITTRSRRVIELARSGVP